MARFLIVCIVLSLAIVALRGEDAAQAASEVEAAPAASEVDAAPAASEGVAEPEETLGERIKAAIAEHPDMVQKIVEEVEENPARAREYIKNMAGGAVAALIRKEEELHPKIAAGLIEAAEENPEEAKKVARRIIKAAVDNPGSAVEFINQSFQGGEGADQVVRRRQEVRDAIKALIIRRRQKIADAVKARKIRRRQKIADAVKAVAKAIYQRFQQ